MSDLTNDADTTPPQQGSQAGDDSSPVTPPQEDGGDPVAEVQDDSGDTEDRYNGTYTGAPRRRPVTGLPPKDDSDEAE